MKTERQFSKGDILASVEGPARGILQAERIALNFVQRMSGIATLTARFVAELAGTKARIVDTRKTTPGLRLFERYAVRCGGGHNHRFSLSDAVMAKDNHLAVLLADGKRTLTEALLEVRSALPHTAHLEVEVDRPDQIEAVLAAGVDTIMLDNFSLEDLRAGVKTIAGRALVEASGIHQARAGRRHRADRGRHHLGRCSHAQRALARSRPRHQARKARVIYLDSAATTPVRREVLEAMWPYLTGEFGNASSHHSLGEAAARALRSARSTIAGILGCRASELVFTSGGTEADNLAIKGIALASPRGRHIVTTPLEHEAVLESCDHLRRHHGFAITYLPVDGLGVVDLAAASAAIHAETTLCSVMLANNEVGTIQPVRELAAIAHAVDVPVHTDAVQGAGVLDLKVGSLGVDALSISGHKVGAPKGIGALFLRGRFEAEPVLHGGGQERGRRSGTENVAGAVGLARAMELAEASRLDRSSRLAGLRDRLIRGVLTTVPDALLTGHPTERLPGNASFCFPGTSGEAVLLQLEQRGIICSSGSACAAGRDQPSHVLVAMGIAPAIAQTAVRFTLADDITSEQIDIVVRAVREACDAVRAIAR